MAGMTERKAKRDKEAVKKDLYHNLVVKCTLLEGKCDRDDIRVCGSCDACQLQGYVSRTVDWFQRASENTKKIFLCGLARRMTSDDLIRYIQQLIQPIACKDYTYSRTRSAPGVLIDEVHSHGDRTLDQAALQEEIFEVWHWFGETSHYAKMNYMLELLKLCDSHLLLTLRNQMRSVALSSQRGIVENLLKKIEDNAEASDPSDYDSEESDETFVTDKHPNLAFLKECKDPKQFTAEAKNPLTGRTFARESRLRKQQRQKAINKLKLEEKKAAAKLAHKKGASNDHEPAFDPALTYPTFSETSASGINKYKDFIRELPVYLSKYILNFLDKKSLACCVRVSRIWSVIGSQVNEEGDIQLKLQEQYTVLQGSSAKGCNPFYAKDIVCPAPEIDPVDKKPRLLPGYKPAPQDFTSTSQMQVNFETAFFGHVTRQIYVEERNIYCGAYNTLILATSEDPNRIIHYSGGKLIALASDKKLYIISVEDGQALNKRPITGHAGSIQCAYIDEKEGYVLTGSYDTSIRMWELETGACKKIYRGHTDSVYALTKYLDTMVTGSKDTTVKVWDISRGVVTMTFKHKDSVLCVDLNGEKLFSGDCGGVIKMWDIRHEKFIKELNGHVGPVLCLKSDKWHLASGGKDGNALIWSTVGKFTRCLGIFRHPKPVMNIHLQDMRVLTGCMDGKMRIWNLLTGDCLRLLRGNSRSEPIYHMWPVGDTRIIINTLSNVLALNFERVEFNYSLEEDKPDIISVRTRRPATVPNHGKGGGRLGGEHLSREDTAGFKIQSHAYLRAQKMKQVGGTNPRIINHPEIPGSDKRPATSGSVINSQKVQCKKKALVVNHRSEKRDSDCYSDWGSEIARTTRRTLVPNGEAAKKPQALKSGRETSTSAVPNANNPLSSVQIISKQMFQSKQNFQTNKTVDSSEPDMSLAEMDKRRRNSTIAGTIQNNSANLNLSEALALLRAQKRQTNQHNVTSDQIFLTVNMIKQAVHPQSETDENTAKNVSNPHIFKLSQETLTRPGSAPYEVDPRQKTKTSEFNAFKPKVPTPPPVEKPLPEPISETKSTQVTKVVFPQKESKLITVKVKSTIPPLTQVKVLTNQKSTRKANQEADEQRPISTARSVISRHQSPMLISKAGKPPAGLHRSKAQDVFGNSNSASFDPFKQYASVDLRTLSQWDDYEKNYQAQMEQEMRKNELKADKEKHRRWLKLARNNSVL